MNSETVTVPSAAAAPCCGTAEAAVAAGACCAPTAKEQALAAGADCCAPAANRAPDPAERPRASGATDRPGTTGQREQRAPASGPDGQPVVVVGAGPVGLAAAAHLHERGLPFVVLEAGDAVATSVRQWGHVALFSPWRYNIDAAARRLLDAAGWAAPDDDALPTGTQLVEEYLQPLAKLPAIAPYLRFGSRVAALARVGTDRVRTAGRAEAPFVVRLADGTEIVASAVVDASGTWRTPNPLGGNGLPAHGEPDVADLIAHALPDVLGHHREDHAGRHTIVVGSGHSAANTLIDLARLAETTPGTRITWAVRGKSVQRAFGGEDADQLPARGALGSGLRALVDTGTVTLVQGFAVHRVRRSGTGVELVATDGRSLAADRVVSATGFRPDHSITTELRLDLDPILGSTRTLAELIDPNEHSCGTVPPHGHTELAHPEPNYYAVGMKSYGRAPTFLMATGYEQVRSVAAALAGDLVDADDVQLDLPQTGVCSADLGAETAARDIAARLGLAPDVPGKLAAATMTLLPTAASTADAVRQAAERIGLDPETARQIATLTGEPGALPSATGLITLAPATGGNCCV